MGSKFQVTCEKHAAYTDNMASPCCCVVRMHLFSTKLALDRQKGPESLRNMPDIAPGTQFFGKFLRQIYPPSLLVTSEKLAQMKNLPIKTISPFSIPITQQKVDSYAFDQNGVTTRQQPPVRPSPLKKIKKVIQARILSIKEPDHASPGRKKQKTTTTGKATKHMGRRLPFKYMYGEGMIVLNQPLLTNLGNQKLSATNMAATPIIGYSQISRLYPNLVPTQKYPSVDFAKSRITI